MTAEQIKLLEELGEVVIYDSNEFDFQVMYFYKEGDNLIIDGNEISLHNIEERAGWDIPVEGDTIEEIFEQVVGAVIEILSKEKLTPLYIECLRDEYPDNVYAEWRYTNGECDSEYSCNICPADYL